MISPLYSASYERALQLRNAGCPIDDLRALPHEQTLHVGPLGGYFQSRVVDLGGNGTNYIVGIRLVVDRGAVVISDWSFVPPWSDHNVNWDYEPCDILPQSDQNVWKSLLNDRLSTALNDRRLVTRGRPVRGILCGWAAQEVPAALQDERLYGNLTLRCASGQTIVQRMALDLWRARPRRNEERLKRRKGRLLDHPDPVTSAFPSRQVSK
jgi:hypothetical protein